MARAATRQGQNKVSRGRSQKSRSLARRGLGALLLKRPSNADQELTFGSVFSLRLIVPAEGRRCGELCAGRPGAYGAGGSVAGGKRGEYGRVARRALGTLGRPRLSTAQTATHNATGHSVTKWPLAPQPRPSGRARTLSIFQKPLRQGPEHRRIGHSPHPDSVLWPD